MLLDTNAEAVSIYGWEIPPLCSWRNMTGMDCLGCGLTRSFVFMGHLQLIESFKLHMLGPLLYVFVVAQVPFRIIQLFRHLQLR